MVIVEGVARSLDPALNVWTAAEPIAREWVEANMGIAGRLREAGEGVGVVSRLIADAPRVLEQLERAAVSLSEQSRQNEAAAAPINTRSTMSGLATAALVVAATALAAIAARLWF